MDEKDPKSGLAVAIVTGTSSVLVALGPKVEKLSGNAIFGAALLVVLVGIASWVGLVRRRPSSAGANKRPSGKVFVASSLADAKTQEATAPLRDHSLEVYSKTPSARSRKETRAELTKAKSAIVILGDSTSRLSDVYVDAGLALAQPDLYVLVLVKVGTPIPTLLENAAPSRKRETRIYQDEATLKKLIGNFAETLKKGEPVNSHQSTVS